MTSEPLASCAMPTAGISKTRASQLERGTQSFDEGGELRGCLT
jgi:hypothetical protein